MSYQKFQLHKATEAKCANPAKVATPTPEISQIRRFSPNGLEMPKKRELHLADIMALPIRPCTTCGQLHWHSLEYENDDGRIRQYRARLCDHYGKRIVSPTRGCRCIHFERKWSIH